MLDVCPTASDAPVSSPTEMPSSDKRDEGPELARNGHPDCSARCPLSGAKRKHILAVSFSGFVKVFGCRPHEGGAAHTGPAYANLQGRKPREVWSGRASDAMGISVLAHRFRSAWRF